MVTALSGARERAARAKRARLQALAALEIARERLDRAAEAERAAVAELDRLERAEAGRVRSAAERARTEAARPAGPRAAEAVPAQRATTTRPASTPASTRPRQASATTAPARPSRDREALARALARTAGLLPTAVVARHGKAERTVDLERGASYRVEPLNPRRRKERGRVGRLTSWDDRATTGIMAWADGSIGPVTLSDLVREA